MISVATALEELGLEPAVEGDADAERRDRILQRMIDAATATLGRDLGRYLGPPQQVVEYKRGGVPLLVLHDDPSTDDDVDAPVIRWRYNISDAWQALDAAQYALRGRQLRHTARWPGGVDGIEVTYTRGYTEDTGPAEFRELILDLVTSKYVAAQGSGATVKSESLGDYSYTNFTALEFASAAFGDYDGFVKRWRRPLV